MLSDLSCITQYLVRLQGERMNEDLSRELVKFAIKVTNAEEMLVLPMGGVGELIKRNLS